MLQGLLQDDDLYVRVQAAAALGSLSSGLVGGSLELALQTALEASSHDDPELSKRAVLLVATMIERHAEGLDTESLESAKLCLTDTLNNADPELSVQTAFLIARLGTNQKDLDQVRLGLNKLMSARADADPMLREQIIGFINAIALRHQQTGNQEIAQAALSALEEELTADDLATRIHAATTLGYQATTSQDHDTVDGCISTLRDALGTDEIRLRRLATQRFANLAARRRASDSFETDVATLAEGLKDRDPGVRNACVVGLGRLIANAPDVETGESVLEALEAAAHDAYPQVRRSVAAAICGLVYYSSNKHLADVGLQRLIEILNGDNDELRVNCLGELATKTKGGGRAAADLQAVMPMVRALLSDDDPRIRRTAAVVLGGLARQRLPSGGPQQPAEERKLATTALIDALQDEDPGVRRIAAAWLSDPVVWLNGQPLLDRAYESQMQAIASEDVALKATAAKALGVVTSRIQNPSQQLMATEALTNGLSEENTQVRLNAATSLRNVASVSSNQAVIDVALPAFQQMFRDEHVAVSSAGATALGQIVTQSPIPSARKKGFEFLVSVLGHENPAWRARAAGAFKSNGYSTQGRVAPEWRERHVVPALVEALRDPNIDVRLAAMDAIHGYALSGTKQPDELIRLLIEDLSNDNDAIRSKAAMSLARQGFRNQDASLVQSSVDAFLDAWKDDVPDVRLAATGGLGSLAMRHANEELLAQVVPGMIERLSDSDSRVRIMAIQVLVGRPSRPNGGKVPPGLLQQTPEQPWIAQVEETLKKLAQDNDQRVRDEATRALTQLEQLRDS